MSRPIIVRNLCKSFGSNKVLDNISLDLQEAESLGVIGGSGTGKSVLIKTILGLLPADRGEVKLFGIDMIRGTYRQRQAALSQVGMLFQGGALFDSLVVWENIAFSLLQSHGVNKKNARAIAIEKLQAVNLDPAIADSYPAELSGGMQKRVALARAIATNPKVIFFDEPTTGLDPIISGTINELIRKCVSDIGASAISITHDIHSLRLITDRCCLIHKGNFIWSGRTSELDTTDNPWVRQFVNGSPKGPFTSGG